MVLSSEHGVLTKWNVLMKEDDESGRSYYWDRMKWVLSNTDHFKYYRM